MLKTLRQIIVLALVPALVPACREKDYFDKEVYDEIISMAFPVTGVDASHGWKTVTTAAAAVSVDAGYGGDCRITIYLDDPTQSSSPVVAAVGTAAAGGTFRTSFSCPVGCGQFYVALAAPDGRLLLKPAALSGGMISCAFTSDDTPVAGEGSWPEGTPFGMRYCFEDNFPQEGDYDFNDVVLTVTPVVDGRDVTLTVSLDAVGTQKQVAAALRVRGLAATALEQASREGDFDMDNGRPAASFNIVDSKDYILPYGVRHTSDLVLLLFNDAHWAMAQRMESNGNVRRYYYNTVTPGSADYTEWASVEPVVVTYRLRFGSADDARRFVADNLDVFIIESSGGSYVEVHTMAYKTSELIYDYISDTSAFDAPYVWALQLPGTFRYPLEGVWIGSNRSGVLSGAYRTPGHSFAEWAVDRTAATDWWKYPASGLVR